MVSLSEKRQVEGVSFRRLEPDRGMFLMKL